MKDSFSNAIQLLQVRLVARRILDSLRTKMTEPSPVFSLYDVEVRFDLARIMLFQNVVCSNWALYDTIAGACGLVCMTDTLAKNPQRFPNLLDFGNNKAVGGHVHDHITAGFGWKMALCYEIRNWVVHAGEAQSALKLFESPHPSTAGFKVADDSWNSLVAESKKRFPNLPNPDPAELITMRADAAATFLSACEEMDRLSSFIVSWSIGSLRLQIELLCS